MTVRVVLTCPVHELCLPQCAALREWRSINADYFSYWRDRKQGHLPRPYGPERQPHAQQLTWPAARDIRARLASGTSGRALALEFMVSRHTIASVRHGRSWRE